MYTVQSVDYSIKEKYTGKYNWGLTNLRRYDIILALGIIVCLSGCSIKEPSASSEHTVETLERVNYLDETEKISKILKNDTDTLVLVGDSTVTDTTIVNGTDTYNYQIDSLDSVDGMTLEPYRCSENLKYGIKDNKIYFRVGDDILEVDYTEGNRTVEQAALRLNTKLLSEISMSDALDTYKEISVEGNKIHTDIADLIVLDREIGISNTEDGVYIGGNKVYWLDKADNTLNHVAELSKAGLIESSAAIKNGFVIFRLKDGDTIALREVNNSLIYFKNCDENTITSLKVEES